MSILSELANGRSKMENRTWSNFQIYFNQFFFTLPSLDIQKDPFNWINISTYSERIISAYIDTQSSLILSVEVQIYLKNVLQVSLP